MDTDSGVIWCVLFDNQGGSQAIDWPAARLWKDREKLLWLHLDRTNPQVQQWLREESGLDELACDALLEEDTRPRCSNVGEGIYLNLRGVNHNPGDEPDDMLALRMWIEPHRIITLRWKRMMSAFDVKEALERGEGPCNAGEFVWAIAERLNERIEPVIDGLESRVDECETALIDEEYTHTSLRGRLSEIRRQTIALHRYLAPQRDAMSRLYTSGVKWLDNDTRRGLHEEANTVTRIVESLEALRQNALVTQEELNGRLAERTNGTIYLLTVVAAIVLPLSLLTGLLGINVDGMPGAGEGNPWAFWIVCIAMAVILVLEVVLFRKMKWL